MLGVGGEEVKQIYGNLQRRKGMLKCVYISKEEINGLEEDESRYEWK